MKPTVHDNEIISYTVNERAKEILFETESTEKSSEYRHTSVLFRGVAAYFFEHHSMTSKSILFDIEEISPESILEDDWVRFEEGNKWGWPGAWGNTKESAKAFFKTHKTKGFEISASCGLSGWVLAESIQIQGK